VDRVVCRLAGGASKPGRGRAMARRRTAGTEASTRAVRRAIPIHPLAIPRVPCLAEEQWEQASLPVKFAGLGVNQTKVIAGPAYMGSCVLTRGLVAALLKRKEYEPPGLAELLVAHETATSFGHDLADLSTQRSVQQRGLVPETDGKVQRSQQQSDACLLNAPRQRLAPRPPNCRPRSRPALHTVSYCTQVPIGLRFVQ